MTSPGAVRSYYGRPVLKLPVWHWYVPAYFFTGGLAAGSALLAAGGRATSQPVLARRCLLASWGAVAVSGVLLIVDLGRPRRFLNMLRVAKVTSPMSVGTWLLSAFGTAVTAATLSELTGIGRRAGRVAEAVAAVLAPAMATYTAVLIADTAVPAWHDGRHELPFVFAGGAAASSGALAVLLVPGAVAARRLAIGGAVVELVAAEVLERGLGDVAEAFHRGRVKWLERVAFGATAAGATVLAAAGRRRRAAEVAGALVLLTGAAAQRFAVYEAGVESAADPAFTVGPQRRRLAGA
ncbi:MAG TPA: NrfD/PsrC family molybdoenzyme membrane anchor subunit [Acidimicrobiales bacterium]|nr:NrfD/PsrC family molybdoenzyme membrane anchor subunit [Acidimicrobiales bacterium]